MATKNPKRKKANSHLTDRKRTRPSRVSAVIHQRSAKQSGKRAEEALQEIGERFRLAFENANIGMCLVDLQGRLTKVNHQMCEIFGYSQEELEGMTVNDIAHPEDLNISTTFIQTATSGEIEYTHFEKRYFHKDGHIVWGAVSSSLVRDPQGVPQYFISHVQDITKRKKTEEALRSERDKFRGMLSAISDGVDIINKNYIIEFQNKLLREYYGDRVGEKCYAAYMGSEEPCNFCCIQEAIGSGNPRRIELVAPNGKNYELSSSPFTDVDGEVKVIELVRDITERKRAEEALRQESLFRSAIIDHVTEGLCVCHESVEFPHVAFTVWNDRMIEITGYTMNEINRLGWYQTMYPDPEIQARAIERMARMRQGDNIVGEEWEITRADGEKRLLSISTSVLQTGDGIAHVLALMQDITKRKRAEEALRESEERYRTILENIEDGYYEVDLHGDFTFFNDSLCRMLGYSRDEMLGMGNQQYTDEENRKKLFQAFNEVYRTGKSTKGFGWEVFRKDGTKLFGEVSVSLIKDSKGQPIGFRGIARDITERKQAEEALRTERQRFQTLIENAPFGMVMIDQDGTFRYINPKFREIFGYDLSDVPDGRTWFRKAYPDPTYRHNVISTWMNDLESVSPGEKRPRTFKVTCKDGTEKIINFIPVQLETGENLMTCEDITERNRADEALRESEERYRTLFEGSRDTIYITTREGKFIDINKSGLELFGYTREELMSLNVQETYANSTDRDKFQKEIGQKGFVRDYELKLRKKGGTEIDCLLTSTVWRSNDGSILGYQGIIRDITEHKLMEEALRDSETRYRTIFENTGTAMLILEEDTTISLANAETEELTGYSREEVEGKKKWTEFIVKEDLERMIEYHHLRRIDPNVSPKNYEFRSIDAKGQIRNIFLTVSMIPKTKKSVASLLDITDLKRAEEEKAALQEQLRQSQKMEAIGRLAGGIAHDFNNLLTIIKGYSQLSLLELKEGDPLWGNMKEIQKTTDRAADLIRHLLAFSRRQILDMKVLDLNSILRDLDKVLHRIIGEDIELVTILAEDLWRVKVDPGQMEQVIMNLAVNARDGMPSGGKLTIETANVELDEGYARSHIAVTPGRHVMLSVSDTGVGMTPEVKERIFEPFFTTKEKGKGTGLGLSTVYGIVKQSGGNIWFYSEPGQGTTCKIYLPRVDEPLEEVRGAMIGEELPRGSETILVVEDEEEVRKLALRSLKRQGYKVLEASNGSEALMICEEQKEPIHLILTDVVMPKMGGKELADRLKTIRPEIKVLFTSGFTNNAIAHHGVLTPGIAFLEKPFSPAALAQKVREVLDREVK